MNERLRAELDYCVPLGIPHSRFLGWDQDDQDKALAYIEQMSTVCSGCGTRKVDWELDRNAYIGDLDHCEGCQRLEEESDNIPEGGKGYKPRLVREDVARLRALELAAKDRPKHRSSDSDSDSEAG